MAINLDEYLSSKEALDKIASVRKINLSFVLVKFFYPSEVDSVFYREYNGIVSSGEIIKKAGIIDRSSGDRINPVGDIDDYKTTDDLFKKNYVFMNGVYVQEVDSKEAIEQVAQPQLPPFGGVYVWEGEIYTLTLKCAYGGHEFEVRKKVASEESRDNLLASKYDTLYMLCNRYVPEGVIHLKESGKALKKTL